MDGITILVSLAVAGAVVCWVAFSPDPLAKVIRVRFTGAKAEITRAVDSALARVDTALAKVESNLAKANAARIQIKTERHRVQNELIAAQADVVKHTTQAENAASIQRSGLVSEALTRKTTAEIKVVGLTRQHAFLVGKEQKVDESVATLQNLKAKYLVKRAEIKTRGLTATTTMSVDELLAGVDLSGNDGDMKKAEELVAELEAKAGAMAEIADHLKAEQRVEDELEALGQPQTPDIQAQTAELMTKYAKPTV